MAGGEKRILPNEHLKTLYIIHENFCILFLLVNKQIKNEIYAVAALIFYDSEIKLVHNKDNKSLITWCASAEHNWKMQEMVQNNLYNIS